MPTITIIKNDLEKLLNKKYSIMELEELFTLAKGEVKDFDSLTGEIKVELGDSNRPDLWCVEGIARQIRYKGIDQQKDYPFFNKTEEHEIIVMDEMKDIRPYVAAFSVKGVNVDEETLLQLIQTQEKISEIFGRRRSMLSIGIYRLSKITFPVFYKGVKPDEVSFIPLGLDEKMTLREILEVHPKGKEYCHILKNYDKYPLLIDSEDNILSFPPIINSRDVGEVKIGDRDLFVEITGTDKKLVLLVLNILASNLYDREGEIGSVKIIYPYDTPYGKEIVVPYNLSKPINISLSDIEKAVFENLDMKDVKSHLIKYGYKVKNKGKMIEVVLPPFRNDIMHTVDIVEDYAISRGYNNFDPILPSEFTVGGLSELELTSDKIREYMVGLGFQEIISNILSSRSDILEKMCIGEDSGEEIFRVAEVENVMSLNYSVLRNWLIPSLLKVENTSSKSFYPHKIFETGEIVISDKLNNKGWKTLSRVGALTSHPESSFSEIHSYLDMLFYYLGIEYRLEPSSHPSFIPGRYGNVIVKNDEKIGFIGELNPLVLDNWGIAMPCAGFELNINIIVSQ